MINSVQISNLNCRVQRFRQNALRAIAEHEQQDDAENYVADIVEFELGAEHVHLNGADGCHAIQNRDYQRP